MKPIKPMKPMKLMRPTQHVKPMKATKPLQPKSAANTTAKHKVEGTLYMVGTDFVDIMKDDCTVVTILRNNMSKIIWHDKVKKTATSNHNSSHRSTHSKHVHYPCHCRRHRKCICRKNQPHHIKKFHPAPSIPACDGMVQLRLGSLTDNLNFHLFKNIGKRVIIECSSH
ncbi:hypothetical protein NKR17_02205 [Priestia flexa]|uniref:hypothetical protein n=1 Tax=Priestia flexa TaxID=86664 RepID=UPI001CD7EEB6|nr:hypothetical protein [Priestia flexa]MCA1202872.1 hypothetical protein [Priestia flexa]MCP1187937.1 hypothetical protein [Priestia flexa]